MIDDFEIGYRWKHRDEFITVCGCYLNEDEVQYLIEVLKYMREDGFLLRDIYTSGVVLLYGTASKTWKKVVARWILQKNYSK